MSTFEIYTPPALEGGELLKVSGFRSPVPRHIHASYCIGIIEAGVRQCFLRGQEVLIPAGQMFVIHPGEVHTSQALDPDGQAYRLFSLPCELVRRVAGQLGSEIDPYFPTAAIADPELVSAWLQFADDLEGNLPQLEAETRLLELLARLIVQYATPPQAEWLEASQEPPAFAAVLQARVFIDNHYSDELHLEALAQVACLSPFHLSRAFTRMLGVPPHTYQTLVRLRHARRLMLLGASLAEAAAQTGFYDQSHFTSAFKKYMGVPPGQFLKAKIGT